jgi:hypothetical protein
MEIEMDSMFAGPETWRDIQEHGQEIEKNGK